MKRLVGAGFFRGAVDAFVRAHPSTCGDLNIYGGRFGEFLAAYPPAALLPHLADVAARLEWAIDEAHRAPDSPRVPEAVLAALSTAPGVAAGASLAPRRFVPSTGFRRSRYCASGRRTRTATRGDDRVALGAGGDALLVRRDPHGISLERVPAGDHAWLAALGEGESLGAAIDRAQRADLTFDLGAALPCAHRRGDDRRCARRLMSVCAGCARD